MNDFEVLYEDTEIVALNKPPGIVMHYDGKTREPNIADWVGKTFPSVKDVGEPLTLSTGESIPRPGIVHRLDRETSGVVLIAKTKEAFFHLKSQFQDRTIQKTYHAFVLGVFKKRQGVIDQSIGRNKKDFRKWSVEPYTRGKLREAYTQYTILQEGEEVSFVEVYPKTGRTHQIRVHFKALHHPVVCDKLYGPQKKMKQMKGEGETCELGFSRLALHARTLFFTTLRGEKKKVTAPYFKDFEKALLKIEHLGRRA